MPIFQKKQSQSTGYFGDLLFPLGEELPAGAAVTLWVLTEEKCLLLRRGKEDTKIPYLRLISFAADNEQRIRDGESEIPAEVLADVPEKSNDQLTSMKQTVRRMSTRWFGYLLYVDECGEERSICMMERNRSGYYLDLVKSLQARDLEEFFQKKAEL